MNVARALAAAVLVIAASRAAAEAPRLSLGAGYGFISHARERGERTDGGVALELRVEQRVTPRLGFGIGLTWGLTDWSRAREWIDAGNRAGRWTSDRFADVEAWAMKEDAREGTRGLRLVGAMVADLFLLMTYGAVPFCYAGSLGGATSHLQADATAVLHLTGAANDAWVEAGLGAAALPYRIVDWRRASGPVVGVGMQVDGRVRISGRLLWSPPGMNDAPFGGTVVTGALTIGYGE